MSAWRLLLPRFFFDLDDGNKHHRDELGMTLPDFAAVKEEAYSLLFGVVQHHLPEGTRIMTVNVRDELGKRIYYGKMTVKGKRFGA